MFSMDILRKNILISQYDKNVMLMKCNSTDTMNEII